MRTLGVIAMVIGFAMAGFALLIFDPTVSGGDGHRVNNIGLLQDRQNLLIAGCASLIAGVLMLVLGKSAEPSDSSGSASDHTPLAPMLGHPVSLRNDITDAFQAAIDRGDAKQIGRMIDGGEIRAYGELPTGRGWLQYAVLIENVEACKALIARGASVDHRDQIGSIARHLAKSTRNAELIAVCDSPAPATGVEVTPEGPPEAESVAYSKAQSRPTMGIAEQLERLVILQKKGFLTPDEFTRAKGRLLG